MRTSEEYFDFECYRGGVFGLKKTSERWQRDEAFELREWEVLKQMSFSMFGSRFCYVVQTIVPCRFVMNRTAVPVVQLI